MPIHFQPITLTLRGFEGEIDTEVALSELKHIPYKFVCTVQIIDDIAYITGFKGTINMQDRRDISTNLASKFQIKEAKWSRGKRNVSVTN